MHTSADDSRKEQNLTIEERDHLVTVEKRATEMMKAGKLPEAIALWEELIQTAVDWEHGLAWHMLAQCYEDIGDPVRAEEAYLRAIEIEPEDDIWVGGYASFLYQQGDAEKSLEQHLRLVKIEASRGQAEPLNRLLKQIEPVFEELGKRLGLPQTEIEALVLKAQRRA